MVVAAVAAELAVLVLMRATMILELVVLVELVHLLKSQELIRTVAAVAVEPLAEAAVQEAEVLVQQVLLQLLEMGLTIKEAAVAAVEADHMLMLLELVDQV